jgi:hypothetical protein
MNDGGPAFPRLSEAPGLSIRDWLAGMAMQGLLSHWQGLEENPSEEELNVGATSAYQFADAMLKARKPK